MDIYDPSCFIVTHMYRMVWTYHEITACQFRHAMPILSRICCVRMFWSDEKFSGVSQFPLNAFLLRGTITSSRSCLSNPSRIRICCVRMFWSEKKSGIGQFPLNAFLLRGIDYWLTYIPVNSIAHTYVCCVRMSWSEKNSGVSQFPFNAFHLKGIECWLTYIFWDSVQILGLGLIISNLLDELSEHSTN